MDNSAFIVLELGKALLVPSTILIITLATGATLLWSRWRRAGRWLTTITAGILVLVATVPVASWVARPLETRFPSNPQLPKSVAGIIVLGGALQTKLSSDWGQPQVNSHAQRLIAFMELARQHPNAQLVFSGGKGAFSDTPQSEAEIARSLFASMGMDTDRIIFEDRSSNTCENAIYTAQLIKPTNEQEWVLVTSAMDMPRAVGVFRTAGFQVLPYPVDYTTGKSETLDFAPTIVRDLALLDHAAHEWLGLLGYRLLGCSGSLFPGP